MALCAQIWQTVNSMNDQQSAVSVAAVRKAAGFFKSHAAFSMATGISESDLSRIVNDRRKITATQAALIARALKGKVTRHELRPDLYAENGKLRPAAPVVTQPSEAKRAPAKSPKPRNQRKGK